MSMKDSKKAEAGLLLLEASTSWCMSMPYSKKSEAGLLLLDKAEVMHVNNDGLEEDKGWAAAPRDG